MIEALESRRLLSVPSIAGHWVGTVTRTVDGGSAETASLTINLSQRGTALTCTETDTLSHSTNVDYCRGSIDARGHLALRWSKRRNMRPILTTGTGKLARGKISGVLKPFVSNGHTIGINFKIPRG